MTEKAVPQQTSPPAPAITYNDESEIARFYQDRVVFITGGTGFIGKVLLEKLLRSCPLKRVYLLIRSKRGVEPKARLQELFKCKVFQRLARDAPDAHSNVRAVEGDLALPDLGISTADLATLVEEVSVVFHLAATVRFNDPLKNMVQLNVIGTRNVMNIAREMRSLCAFVHVSTAYTSWRRKDVQEMVYPAPIDAQKLIDVTRSSEEKRVGSKRKLRFGQPNNYALTKAVTESLILDEQKELPLAIVRPSVVTASWKEPFPGWIDNYYTCTGVIVSVAMGLLPLVLLSKDCIADLIPVDVVANTIICVGWQVAKIRPTQLKVYNCASSNLQPHTWGEVNEQVKRTVMQYPLPHTRRFSRYIVTTSKVLYRLSLCFLCYVPAFFGDLALRLTGKKASNVALYRKVIKGMEVMHFYTTNSWLFRSQNVVTLINDLSPTDKQLFDIDVRKMDWCQYWNHYMLGIHKYLLKIDDAKPSQECGQV